MGPPAPNAHPSQEPGFGKTAAPSATDNVAAAASDGKQTVELQGHSLVSSLSGRSCPILTDLHRGAVVQPYKGGCVVGLHLEEQAPSDFLEAVIGQLHCRRFLALARAKLYWMVPSWGHTARELPPETQLLLLDLEDGHCGLLAPLIDGGAFRTSIRPPRPRPADPPSSLLLRVESGANEVHSNTFTGLLFVASGTDPFALLESGVAAAASLSGSGRPRWEKPTPHSLDLFTWCTWDAMYVDVNPAGIHKGLAGLAAGGTPARVLLIDDGWQHTDVDERYKPAGTECTPLHHRTSARLALERRVSELLAHGNMQASEPLKTMAGRKAADEQLKPGPPGCPPPDTPGALSGPPTTGGAQKGTADGTGLREYLVNSFRGLAAALLTAAYRMRCRLETGAVCWLKSVLEDSSSDSARLHAFCKVAVGPLRDAVLRFYAASSWHSRRLLSLNANAKFSSPDSGPVAGAAQAAPPGALGQVVAALKAEHGLRYVLCWHAMAGYWSGLMPGAPAVEHLKPRLIYPRFSPGTLEVDPSMLWAHPAVAGMGVPEDPVPLHREMHAYLAESGVDGVKVDVQATIAAFGHASGGYAATSARWHAAVDESVAALLPGSHQINSMCCSMEDLYNMSHSNISRVGEDFYPSLPASHTAHIANASFCTLMVSVMAWPDWDMFHSDHSSAHLHAAARAISGGMVYVSDRAGDHDFKVLRRLVLPDGSVLRCNLPGRPTADCLFRDVSRDGKTVLKVWNMNACTGVVGAFNVQGSTWSMRKRCYYTHQTKPPALRASVRPADVPLLPPARLYAVYSDALQEVRLLGRQEVFPLVLAGAGGHDLLAVSPVLEAEGLSLAPVGLTNMFNAGGAVLSVRLGLERGHAAVCEADVARVRAGEGVVCHITARGCGTFLLHATARPLAVAVDGQALTEADVSWDSVRQRLSFPLHRHCTSLGHRHIVLTW